MKTIAIAHLKRHVANICPQAIRVYGVSSHITLTTFNPSFLTDRTTLYRGHIDDPFMRLK
jgi:hypothetical protein